MYSLWNRLNTIVFFSITVLVFLAIGSSFTRWMFVAEPKVSVLEIKNVHSLRKQQDRVSRKFQDRAIVSMDIDADLTSLFNWNVKQLFVYISATYKTSENVFNEVVIWDKVVQNKKDALIQVRNAMNKYPLIDYSTDLRGTPITLNLAWDIMPITGTLIQATKSANRIEMPPQYCSEEECAFIPLPLDKQEYLSNSESFTIKTEL